MNTNFRKKAINGAPQIHSPVPKNYWDHPVYQFVARHHRLAEKTANAAEMARLSELMRQFTEGSIPESVIAELETQRQLAEKQAKADRKNQQVNFRPPQFAKQQELNPQVNIAALKQRIFNQQTSSENRIRAFEALPKQEKAELVKRLPPYIKSLMDKYLKSRGYL